MNAGQSSRDRFRRFRATRESPESLGQDDAAAPAPVRVTNRWDPIREYARWLRPQRGEIIIVFVIAAAAALVGLVPPYASKLIIDHVLTPGGLADAERWRWLHLAGGAVLLLLLVQQGIEWVRQYRLAVLNVRVLQRLRLKLYRHLLRLPLQRLYQIRTGGVVTHLSNDVDDVTGLLQTALITPGVAGLRVLLTIGMLLYLQWQMALAAMALVPPIIVLNMMWVRRIRPIYRSIRRDRSETNARVSETFGGIRVVRAFRRERGETRAYAVRHHLIIRKRLFADILELVVTTGWGLLIPATSLMVIWFGGVQMLRGQTTIGGIVAFQMYVFMLLHPVSQIVFSYGGLQRALASMERMYVLLREPADKPDRAGAIDVPRPLREMTFEHVDFAYADGGRTVLFDINLRVEAGQTVALVGPSGAGKTTVTNLVARFYDPSRGVVRVNGVDLRDVRLESYRSLLGVVEQDVFLFEGTVRENIAFGRRAATDEEVIAAARRANAHEFISAFPDGYETIIGERGVKLSGGQRQRVSIARALLADPEVLILDEATSNLDTESEQLIQAGLLELFSNRTTFVIAHRLSTILHADLIVVMQEGRVVETGTHAELMEARGQYHEMIGRQMRHHTDIADTLNWS